MLNNKKILITGGTGSWGNELVKQILEKYNPKEIIIYSRGEHKQVKMKMKFNKEKRIKYFIGDVRDKKRLLIATREMDYIFHLAALKHVPICEENPWESVLTNIYGTRNVVECAIENNVKKVVYVSTDKAVDPFNLYGTCKAVGEKIITAANKESNGTSFVCIRAGNVIGTNGSVIPLFKEQILKNNEITLTSDKMTRFFLSLEEAISLIFRALKESKGGEIFVMKMPSIKIQDLAEVMIEKLGNEKTNIKNIGVRPGEKIYEVLVSKYEKPYCFEMDDNYFVILPKINRDNINEKYKKIPLTNLHEFNSENTHIMNKKEIGNMLKKGNFIKEKKSDDQFQYYEASPSKEDLKNIFKNEGWQKK